VVGDDQEGVWRGGLEVAGFLASHLELSDLLRDLSGLLAPLIMNRKGIYYMLNRRGAEAQRTHGEERRPDRVFDGPLVQLTERAVQPQHETVRLLLCGSSARLRLCS